MAFWILSQPALPSDPATKWAVLGFVAFAIVYVALIRPHRKKKDPLDRGPAPAALSQQRSVEREMSNLLVELSDMARQMTAQLDTRAAKLEVLIKEADARIAAMKAATGGGTAPLLEENLPAPATPAFAVPVHDLTPAPAPALDPRHAAVYELADLGHSPHEIAQELGRPNGEIELILALRNGA